MTGLANSPGKVWLLSLEKKCNSGDPSQLARNKKFQDYIDRQSLFRGDSITCVDQIYKRANEALHNAMVTLTRRGVREAGRGKFSSGAALDWSRLSFVDRQNRMIKVIHDAILEREQSTRSTLGAVVSMHGSNVLFVPTAVPAAMNVAAAREMIGQPFLHDHKAYNDLRTSKSQGPVHLIACHKTITEAQALKLLGFPDATVLATPFGVYVADDIQKIQMVLVANCRDETTTQHGIQRFFEWLDQTGEGRLLAQRAASRRKIVQTIAKQAKVQ